MMERDSSGEVTLSRDGDGGDHSSEHLLSSWLDRSVTESRRFFLKLYVANVCVVGCVYVTLMMHQRFSLDSFAHMFNYTKLVSGQLEGARFTNAIIQALFYATGFDPLSHQKLSYSLVILAIALFVTLLARIFLALSGKTSMRTVIAVDLALMVSFTNVTFLLLLLFPEVVPFLVVALPCLGVSIYLFVKGGRWYRYAISFLMLVLATGTYQSFLSCFFSFCCAATWFKYRKQGSLKRAIGGWLLCFVFPVCAGAACIIIRSIAGSLGFPLERVYQSVSLSLQTVVSNIGNVIAYQPTVLKDATGLLPSIVFPVFLLVLLVFLIVACRRYCSISQVVTWAIVILLSYAGVFATHYVETTPYYVARIDLGLWCFVASLQVTLVLVYLDGDGCPSAKSPFRLSVLIPAMCVFFIISSLSVQDICLENAVNTQENIDECQAILARIYACEDESGATVKKIAFCYDSDVGYLYPGAQYGSSRDTGTRMLTGAWDVVPALRYVSGRDFEQVDMPDDIYQKYFADRNWNYVQPDEQVVVEGDTAYICIY